MRLALLLIASMILSSGCKKTNENSGTSSVGVGEGQSIFFKKQVSSDQIEIEFLGRGGMAEVLQQNYSAENLRKRVIEKNAVFESRNRPE